MIAKLATMAHGLLGGSREQLPGPEAVHVTPAARDNGLATMLATLIQQNLEDHPDRRRALAKAKGRLAIIAEDADVALTMVFENRTLTVYDQIVGIPDVTVRGHSETIGDMPRMESLESTGLPDPRGSVNRDIAWALLDGRLKIYGWLSALPLLARFGQLTAV